ncbi:transcription initiation factor TFIID subunit 7-like [Convolutriloba macropyga]|uniref:transcription initiation factor TFIID subunit 7-like n=1 Tax=Convolutriloba macropyga TaxID=536237 RepID=UPI003F5227A4
MSKRSEEQVDPEQQFILRLPDDIATKLDSELSTLTSSCSKLAISIDSDYRNCEVNYDGELIKAKLHDLPCVVESLKTTDGKNYYKTADICQIMIAERASAEKYNNRKSKRSSKVYLYPHGLTPPLKNVRRSRFRKILKKKYIESPDVENEVKALLKSDLYAVSLPRYELVDDTTEANKDSHGRAELNKVFEEVSSEDEAPSTSTTNTGAAGFAQFRLDPDIDEPHEMGSSSSSQLDDQVRHIMREISEIQKRRQQIKQKLATLHTGSEKLTLDEELSLLHSKESTKLMYLEELRSRMTKHNSGNN